MSFFMNADMNATILSRRYNVFSVLREEGSQLKTLYLATRSFKKNKAKENKIQTLQTNKGQKILYHQKIHVLKGTLRQPFLTGVP